MEGFKRLFSLQFIKRPMLIGMVHIRPLPGTPLNRGVSLNQIEKQALKETELLAKHDFDALIVENMFDIPYIQNVGPEIIASMTKLCSEIRSNFPKSKPVGVQILAGENQSALAVALASGLQFIRAEAFVYGHVADEGWMDAQAGELLRYRKNINAEHISIFTDIKKKHSAHQITSDVSIGETASAASFFLSDGLIVTGSSTGAQANPNDLSEVIKATPNLPVLIGSGITPENAKNFEKAHGFIVGSYLKQNGNWNQEMDEDRLKNMAQTIK